MPPSTTAHPAEADLAAFALGKLASPAADTVRAHLETCPACRTVAEQTPPDSFMALLRNEPAAPASPHAATPSRQAAVTRGDVPAPVPPVDPDDLPPALRHHPRYRILRQLGRGGMGVVYQAEHTVMERLVALKVISRQLVDSAEAVERFAREVRAAAKLDHPNIDRAYDAEQADDLQLLVMEYVNGLSLADVLHRKGPLKIANACHYIRQAALGLQHAHEKGMVHRDLKPHNLMLTQKGAVKILDFGLAKLNSERKRKAELTQKDMAMGTPEYMAPEQALDTKTAEIRADIYALGCTLYCLLAGRPPFRSEDGNDLQVVLAHIDQAQPPVTNFRPDVPADLADLVTRMLAKAPDQRPQTPKEVAEALAAIGKPGAAKTISKSAFRPMTASRIAKPDGSKDADSPFAELSPSSRPDLTVGPKPSGRRPPWLVAAAVAGVLAVAAAVAGIVIRVPTKAGVVTLEVNPPDAKVEVEDGTITVSRTGDAEPWTIAVAEGGGRLKISKAGFEVKTQEVTLSDKGGLLRVQLDVQPPNGGNERPGLPLVDLPEDEWRDRVAKLPGTARLGAVVER